MMIHTFCKTVAILAIGVVLSSFVPLENITIWMIGDSTMSIKREDKFPETGWGVPFEHLVRPEVRVVNKAVNGRSTRSCISSGTWSEVHAGLKEGDFLVIQFGHNDEKVHKPQVGTSIPEYKENLALFVREARIKGATPILLNSIARRNFVDGKLVETHGAYPEAVRAVADSLHVLFLDLTAHTNTLLQDLGEQKSAQLFLHLDPGHDNYPNGVTDNTHLNVSGADTIARMVRREWQKLPGDWKSIFPEEPQ